MRVCREPRNAACLRAFHREKQTGGDSLPPVFCCASKGAKGVASLIVAMRSRAGPGSLSMRLVVICLATSDRWTSPASPLRTETCGRSHEIPCSDRKLSL